MMNCDISTGQNRFIWSVFKYYVLTFKGIIIHLFSLYKAVYIQWGQKVFSQSVIVQVLLLRMMREVCNFHHRYTLTMRDKMRKKNRGNHIVGFLKNLFVNYGEK